MYGSRNHDVKASRVRRGRIRGKEVFDTAVVTLVSGPVILRRASDRAWHKTVHSKKGHFVVILPAGRYLLTGEDGDAVCPTVDITVRASHTARAVIACRGR